MDAVAQTVIDEVNTATGNGAEVKNPFVTNTPLHLATKVDLSKLSDAEVRQYAEAAQARLEDACTGGLLVDKRTGQVYTEGKSIGTVIRPVKAPGVIPSACRVKQEHVSGEGSINLPPEAISKTTEGLVTNTVAALRFLLAGQKGNGFSLAGQKGKDREAVAVVLGTLKGGLA